MDLAPDVNAISSLVDLLGAALQLAAAVLTLVAAAAVRGQRGGRRGGRNEGDDA
ncbi:hypothetical protein [Micromonospora tarensis]|uniref:Uncharacterized protein n=1 Tax=Micromonospora tarensis TaxID=2806100 RepID=A0ABS1YL29_9ACTN|nr:hypothetical protein [Micromonospora tarensis]MBM0278106.1 hypothetical protein [Micromonospora tarensis]